MTTQTMSRLLITALALMPLALGCYWLSLGSALYGAILFFGSLGILAWVWKPWEWFGRSS